MIYKFSVRNRGDESGPGHLVKHLPDLIAWRDYYVEVLDELDDQCTSALVGALADPMTQRVTVAEPLPGDAVQVEYKRGIVDNENDSIVALCRMHGVSAVASRVAQTYQSASPVLPDVIVTEAFNGNIEEMHFDEPEYSSLMPVASYEPMQTFDLRCLDESQLAALGRGSGRSL